MRQRREEAVASTTGGPAGGLCSEEADGLITICKRRLTFVKPSDDPHFNFVCSWAVFLVGVCLVAENLASTAYGRFGEGAYVTLPPHIGWWLMELPVTITFAYFFFVKGGSQSREPVPRFCAAVMCWHYAYRGWIFPFSIVSHKDSKFSLVPALFGSMVTVTHGYLNAKWFAEHGKHLNRQWLRSPLFRLGIAMYASGFYMLTWHDTILRNLRTPGGPRYSIPRGGLFEYATCAQYFCELWTFLGFWLISAGPNGAFIFMVSVSNLVPRSVMTTTWYKKTFPGEYPERYHLIPFIF